MKVLLFGDLHIYKHANRSIFEDIAINFLTHIRKYCKENNIEKVVFLGDWFHIKNKLSVPAFVRSINTLKKFNIDKTFIIGNHDMPNMGSTDYSIIHTFEPYGNVISLYDWEDVDGVRFHYLSYTDELPTFKLSNKNILFGHLDIQNMMMENTVCKDGFKTTDFSDFDLVFSGHFHKHQVKDNIIYVGSPYQTRYSERHDDKGFVVLDTDDLTWEFVKYNAPRFIEMDIDNIDVNKAKGNFVRIKVK